MTRFARAKGSKASNEKAPEDSTPWEVMKEQLLKAKKEKEESKNRQEAEQQRIQNYENFLKEQKVQKRKATWCDFPEAQTDNSDVKKRNKNQSTSNFTEGDRNTTNGEKVEVPPKKKKKNKTINMPEQAIEVETTAITSEDITSTKKKKKNKNKNKGNDNNTQQNPGNTSNDTNTIDNIEIPCNKTKSNQASSQTNRHQSKTDFQNNHNFKNNKPAKKKQNKIVNGQPQRRKDINDKSFQIIINGKEVELERVDGFPVMKKDAERLNELRENMVKKGIPKSEIQRTLKLERRRAEKALARVRKEVCYNCRKGGHNLSDCPDLKNKIPGVEAGEGICFKCGSTEHRQFECKVQRDKEFRFATCFICKEPGHIARQCPDNPKGLYPNGGGCKLCGDVTHLRKDCPTASDKKEEKSIKLSTLESNDNVEGIQQDPKKVDSSEPAKKVKKIKF
ncbi:uncharacterized protein DDB_G0287625-like [Plodia interpunctella]|uniref:uncharacterized protein DDB_G0287625-like n=1 Tax=Plodia interpunctella TaxID=58824 RepID=UPI002368AC50|nr:uncharacterized protein DDB_G0287625-like [Plodia interpunctella]